MLQRPVTWTLLRHTALTAAPASAPGSIDGAAIDAASSAPAGTAPAAATPAWTTLHPACDPPSATTPRRRALAAAVRPAAGRRGGRLLRGSADCRFRAAERTRIAAGHH